jgi:hypothetical protein
LGRAMSSPDQRRSSRLRPARAPAWRRPRQGPDHWPVPFALCGSPTSSGALTRVELTMAARMANRGLLRRSRSCLARPPCGSGDICHPGGSSPQQASTSLEPLLSRAPATVDDQLRKDAGGSSSVSPTSPGRSAATQIHKRAPGHRAEVALGPSPSTWADVKGTFSLSRLPSGGCRVHGVLPRRRPLRDWSHDRAPALHGLRGSGPRSATGYRTEASGLASSCPPTRHGYKVHRTSSA